MNDPLDQHSQDKTAGVSPEGPGNVSAGAMLRQIRVSRGVHIAALAVSLRVPVKKLEALEGDRFDLLHDVVFARALASSVCRALKADPSVILDLLPRPDSIMKFSESRDLATSREIGFPAKESQIFKQIPKSALLAISTLLLAAFVLLLVPDFDWFAQSKSDATPSNQIQSGDLSKSDMGLPSNAPSTVSPGPEPSSQFSQAAASTSQPLPLKQAQVLGQANVSPPSVTPQGSANSTEIDRSTLLQFKTRGESWVRVTDAKGETLLSRNLASGESAVVAQGELPMQVIVGRAGLTDVLVRGVPFQIQDFAREGVARFEVKQ